MVGVYPNRRYRKRLRVVAGRYVGRMLLWGLWVLAALFNPALLDSALLDSALLDSAHPASLVLGLAVVAAALLIVFLAPAPVSATVSSSVAFARRSRTAAPPRLIDPDAAGRPRPRAPSVRPAA
jgi:hypothetical protein